MSSAGPALNALFKPIEPPTAFEQAVERLARAITLGLLSPGERLPPERDLAEQLAISRTTLRQALTTLQQSGLITSSRGRGGGTFVSDPLPIPQLPTNPVDEEHLHRILDYRLAIETGVVARACERAESEEVERLLELTRQMDDPGEFECYRQADMLFHLGLAEAAHSPRLVEAMAEVQHEVDSLVSLVPHPAELLRRSNEQHRELIARLLERDGHGAVRIIREHLKGTEHFLSGLIPLGQIASK